MTRNPDWYNLNEQRPWPLDDLAKLVDDRGLFLPHDIIADLYLKFPSTLGDRAFLSSLTVGPGIVTCTFLSSASGYTPIASISLPKPVDVYRHYALESLYPGVGGWIVFGSGLDRTDLRSYRFTNPTQSLIQLQSARKYSPRPLTSLGKLYVEQALTGVVKLSAGNDIEIVKESRDINGVMEDAIVIRLAASLDQVNRNVLDEYRGPCGRRPESRNCGSPEPIEFINNVGPDCCGNITLEFRGCVAISKNSDDCSIVLDCGFGLGEACPTGDRLPDATGKLPNEYDDLCADAIAISIDLGDETEPIPGYMAIPSGDGDTMASLPVSETFEDGTTGDMDVVRGEVSVGADDFSGQSAFFTDGGGANVLVFDSGSVTAEPGWTTLYKKVTTGARIRSGDAGALHNAGVVINYRTTVDSPTTFAYWLVDITWDDVRQFRIRRYNGFTYTSIAEVSVPDLAIDNRYTIDVVVEPVSDTSDAAWITATLTGVDDAVTSSLGPTYVTGYRPAEGTVGLFSNRSATEFTYITVANNPVT